MFMNKTTISILIISLITLAFILAGCNDSNVPGPIIVANDSEAKPDEVVRTVNDNTQFALDVYTKLAQENEGNVFLSPWSISSALAMTAEGAKGDTLTEMRNVLHLADDDTVRRSSFAAIYNQINKKDKEYKLHTANALWAQQDYEFLQEYFDTVEDYYGGKVTNVDFVTETERARIMINDWVAEKTNDKIKDIIPPGVLDSTTRLVLSNAIYFKGTWVKEFTKKDTHDAPFRMSPDKTITVDMMVRDDKDAKFNYYENEDLQVLEMLYKGEELSMLVLLPKDEDMAKLEQSLTAENLAEWREGLFERTIDVYMPKFKFETKYFMVETLSEMGMPTAFNPTVADFSGMTGGRDLFISQVIHQAFVDVNEEGTEAAAATVIVMELTTAGPMNNFRADHPFIFIIQERETGNILFMGRVVDPTE